MGNYTKQILLLTKPSFEQIREIAKLNCGKNCPGIECCEPWNDLDHGVALLDTNEKLCKYLCAYGNMHEEKMQRAFATIKETQNFFNQELTIIDWGCGQGLATICFFDYLSQAGFQNNTKRVILIEPSKMALSRAKLHINSYLKDKTRIKLVNKFLDDVSEEDIITDTPIVLHFFSNILDIPNINLKKLAQNIGYDNTKEQYLYCITPLNYGNQRIEAFYSYFKEPTKLANEEINALPKTRKTLKLLVFKLEVGKVNLIKIEYYPPVQFHAAYWLDFVAKASKGLSDEEKQKNILATAFEVAAPFDIGASIYDDVHPILAVLNNIVTRGLPTRTSPFIENIFEGFGNKQIKDDLGNIKFGNNNFHNNDLFSSIEYLTPIAVARVQKTILEALMTKKISVEKEEWDVLVIERDVPCAAIAFADLKEMFKHLTALIMKYSAMNFPKVKLEVITTQKYVNSPLHLDVKPSTQPSNQVRSKVYDMVIDISVLQQSNISSVSFSEYYCNNNCYFNIRSIKHIRSNRYIYTSDTIEYLPLVTKDKQGNYIDISENRKHLQYFLHLLFRKEDFLPGQLPILDRALQNKSVIGLLPTGGGKSLTYQLAAMLQPGVTIVIDPLRSLMKDQYDGLINAGIDTCTFINSTLSSEEKNKREKQMESSQMQFVFLSPERLCIYKFRERLKTMRDLHVYFAYGVIDEVHCVSEWGHDFRTSYLHLGRNLYNYVLPKNHEKRLTLFGLTATASFDVLADVERELSGNSAFPLDADTIVRYENTNRLELQYRIEKILVDNNPLIPITKWDIFEAKNNQVSNLILKIPHLISELQADTNIQYIKGKFIEREGLNYNNNDTEIKKIKKTDLTAVFTNNWFRQNIPYQQSGIVFCPHKTGSLGIDTTTQNRGMVDAIITDLNCNNIGTFKGGDGMNDQDRFINDELPIMVATKAFGMGIDKPNVRFTINVNMSSSLEGFVQEAGRAGRDRRMALAIILYSDFGGVDQDVQMFFHNNNFRGEIVEKQIMHRLLSRNETKVFYKDDEEFKTNTETIPNFLETYLSSEMDSEIVAFINYPQQKNDTCLYNKVFYENSEVVMKKEKEDFVIVIINGIDQEVAKKDIIYKSDIAKAIYRMCCINLIDDFTEDYAKNCYRIVTKRKADGEYYKGLKHFLMRYYSADRAEEEIQKVPSYRGDNEIHKCLSYLTEFIYEKIAVKRKRAIDDMRTFCIQGLDGKKDWKEVNEDLKDFIYYYFNSKYAKDDYAADNGEAFSLTLDTERGKKSQPDIVLKYMRVIDEALVGAGGTPKDNVKHLQGAVRLIRRSLTDTNPALDLLNAFCLLYQGTNDNVTLEEELRRSYQEGLIGFSEKTSNHKEFWDFFENFHDDIKQRTNQDSVEKLEVMKDEITANIHAKIIRSLTNKYIAK